MSAIIKEERIGGQRLILGDCRDVLPALPAPQSVVTDPPYGIGAARGIGKYGRRRGFKGDWDDRAADVSFLPDVPSIIWGGNYFGLPASRGFLVWDKGAGFRNRDFAECEMAWVSWGMNARVFTRDPLARGDYRDKHHPTQKPVPLMEWCIGLLPDGIRMLLDPFMGSGTTLVAAEHVGFAGIGIERDPDYFAAACRRVDEAARAARYVHLGRTRPGPEAMRARPVSAAAWLAGATHRWHANPFFAATGDRVDGHSARVAILILAFMPDAPADLLRGAITHDLGENAVGDIPSPVKRSNPDLYAAVEALEADALAQMGLALPTLPPDLAGLLRLCDGLDAYLWAVTHRPDHVERSEAWQAMFARLQSGADALGLRPKFNEIVKGVCNGKF